MINNIQIATATGPVTVYSLTEPTIIKAEGDVKTDRVVFTSVNWFYRNGAIVVRQKEAV